MQLAPGVSVTIVNPTPPRVVVAPVGPSASQLVVVPSVGPQGPPGPVSGTELVQATPAASWSFLHTRGRRPAVAVYVGDVLVGADVVATATTVAVTFPTPQSGSIILN